MAAKKNLHQIKKAPLRQSKFLVCINEKEHSDTALHFACVKAKATDSHVVMLYVIDPVDYNTLFSVADLIKEERKQDAKKLLKQKANAVHKSEGIEPIGLVREGKITDEIISVLEDDPDISLLILGVASDGSSSKGGLLQQLTSAIGDRFHIPLMLVPGNLTDQQIEALARG